MINPTFKPFGDVVIPAGPSIPPHPPASYPWYATGSGIDSFWPWEYGESQALYNLKRSGDAVIKGVDWTLGFVTGLPAKVIEWVADTADKSSTMAGRVGQNAIVNAAGNAVTMGAGYLVPFSMLQNM